MKRGIVRILLLTFLIGVFYTASASADPFADIGLVDAGSSITVGDPFEIEVWLDGDNIGLDLVAFGFDVDTTDSSLDGDNISYVGATIASVFDDDSGFTDVAGSAFPGITEDDVLLATLLFTADSAGTETISVSGIYDEMFSGLYYELPDWSLTGYDINASITIEVAASSQPVPEPATLLLFGAGLVAIGRGKKYKKI